LNAFIHFFQAQIAQASAASSEASRLLQEIGGYAYVDDHVAWLRLVLCQLHGDWRGFDDTYAEVTQRWQTQTSSLEYVRGFIYMRGRALWQRGQMYGAQAALAELRACEQPTMEPDFDQSCQHLLAGLVAIAKGEVTHAEAELRAAITHHQRLRHTILLNHPRLALATCYGQQDRWSDSMRELRAVVEEVRERGMPGVILQEGASMIPVLEQAMRRGVERDYVAPLLAILQEAILQEDVAPQTIALPDSDDYLTARESEVLRLLATGATNPTIAAALTITERTVKAHVTRILAKLNVTTRTAAVVKVKQLGLL
jgi:ATP/maltotriose-dependent transcriptional regulator MalT